MSGDTASPGTLFVISGPSGVGKRTLLDKVLPNLDGLVHPISATTRAARAGELHGRDYYFLTPDEFQKLLEEDAFVEYAKVHEHWYGTLHSELDKALADGRDVVLELDVQGMQSMKEMRDNVVAIFIVPPTMEELKRRLRERGTVTDLDVRMATAEREMELRDKYDHVVVNDDAATAAQELARLIEERRAKAKR